jgi:cytochrome oxidase assembly protein ShyY1
VKRRSAYFRFYPEWRITLFVLVMIPLMVGLGFWQLQRAEEKAALEKAFELKQQRPPALLAELAHRSARDLAYLPVSLLGRFREEEYFLLDNRIQGGRFGYEVLAVLELAGSEQLALVNRGWIAGDPARRELPEVPEVAGTVRITGHVYVAPGEPYLLAEQVLETGWPKRIQAVEMDKLSAPLAVPGVTVFPYPVRIDSDQTGALSVDWQVINMSPDKHRAYAAQWFVMAAVLAIFYLLRCSNLRQLLSGSSSDQHQEQGSNGKTGSH